MDPFSIMIPVEQDAVLSENGRQHRMVKAAITKDLRGRGKMFGTNVRNRRGSRGQLERAVVIVWVARPQGTLGDAANFTPTVKALFDGMVADAKFLPNDNDRYVRGPFILPADRPASAPGRTEFTFEFYPADYFPTQTHIRAALADFLPRLTGGEVMTHGEV